MAAVLSVGSQAVIGGFTAMSLWVKDVTPPAVIEVIVPRQIHKRSDLMITCTRSQRQDEVSSWKRIPLSTIPRALVDLADTRTPCQLANLMHKAAYRRRLNMKKVEDTAARYPTRRGHASLARAIELYSSGSAGTRSTLEDEFLELIAHNGIPPPLVNTRVATNRGLLEVDCYWPTHSLCVEIDGSGHRRPRTIREDAERDRQLRAVGFRVIRFSGEKIQRFPNEVVAELSIELQQLRMHW